MGAAANDFHQLGVRARWGRLLSEADAAEYLSISRTTLRGLGIAVTRIGRRALYDVRALDRYVDRMDQLPVSEAEIGAAVADEERRFFEGRARRGRH